MRTTITLAVLGAGLLCPLGGCTKDGDTFLQEVLGAALPGNFPGAPATTHYVASDGQALAEPSVAGTTGLRYFPSGDGVTGIVLYASAAAGAQYLYAHFFDGARFSSPVLLAGGNQDAGTAPTTTDAIVLFINKPLDARHGDAIVVWRRLDLDDFDSSTTAGANKRIFYSYFDRSVKDQAASGTNGRVQYGFDTVARTVDTVDEAAVHVTCMAPFGDGLHGAAFAIGDAILAGGANLIVQGDPVSYLGLVYIQRPNSSGNPQAWQARFDLSAGNTTNAFSSPGALPMDTTYSAAADTVIDVFQTYDGSVFTIYSDASASDGNLNWNVYGSSAAPSGFLSNGVMVNAVDGNNNNSSPLRGLVGPDEGVVNLVGAFETSGLTNTADNSLFAVQFDQAAGTYNPANDRVEIDADATNGGTAPVLNNNSTPSRGDPLAQINRTGEYLQVAWSQARSTTQAGVALWTRAIQLTRTGTAPAINTRTSGSGAQQVDAITTGSGTTGDQTQQFKFQAGLGYRSQGFQSNRYAMHLIWHQDNNPDTLDRVRTRQVTFAPSSGVGNPAALTLGTERTQDFNAAELANTGTAASPGGFGVVNGVDGGGIGGTSGELNLYYVRNITASASTAPASFRAFQKIAGGTPREVGSLIGGTGSSRECAFVFAANTPANGDITGNPDWAGSMQHVLLQEARYDNTANPGIGGNVALRHRVFDKDSTNPTIESRFTPAATSTAPPADLDDPMGLTTTWPIGGFQSAFGDGNTVGAIFVQGGEIWYNEFNPLTRTWYQSGGAPKPELISHDGAGFLFPVSVAVNAPVGTADQDLRRFIVFWSRFVGSTLRLRARVRD